MLENPPLFPLVKDWIELNKKYNDLLKEQNEIKFQLKSLKEECAFFKTQYLFWKEKSFSILNEWNKFNNPTEK